MELETRGIVLHKFRYQESGFIVQVFTKEKGKLSFLVKNSKRKRQLLNLLQPMTAIQMQCSFRETKDIHYIKEAHLYRDPGMEIYMDPIKGSLTFFMAELVKNGLFPSYENKELFEFCENSILELQEADAHQTALFPLYFTLMLCSYLGIAIHLNEQSEYFDLVHAHATARKPEHKEYLCRQELELLRALLGTKFDDLTELKTIKSVRLKLLRSLLKYIHFQMEHFKDLKSLNVLEQIFNN